MSDCTTLVFGFLSTLEVPEVHDLNSPDCDDRHEQGGVWELRCRCMNYQTESSCGSQLRKERIYIVIQLDRYPQQEGIQAQNGCCASTRLKNMQAAAVNWSPQQVTNFLEAVHCDPSMTLE